MVYQALQGKCGWRSRSVSVYIVGVGGDRVKLRLHWLETQIELLQLDRLCCLLCQACFQILLLSVMKRRRHDYLQIRVEHMNE